MGMKQTLCGISSLVTIGSHVIAVCVLCCSGSIAQADAWDQCSGNPCDQGTAFCDANRKQNNVPMWHQPSDWFEAERQDSRLCAPAMSAQTFNSTPCTEPRLCATPAARASQWIGGFEFLWMRANFDQNVALIIDPPVGNTLVPFEYDRQLSTRTWLGWQSKRGGGFRATYWEFDEQAGDESVTAVVGATPVFVFVYGAGNNLSRSAQAGVGQTLTSQHRLKLQAFDLEATQQFDWNSLRGTLSCGVRIADMEQLLRGDVVDGVGALQESIANDLTFQGAGPTVAMKVNRAIAASRLAMYGGMRGSLIMGETNQKIYEMKGAFTTELEDLATQREVITAFELALGLQWNQPIGRRCTTFARAGYECQTWIDAGGPVDSHSTISLDAIAFGLGMQF
ncbi:hypothetical protein Poly59_48510 [Rubripirellula reticaptiva]|uniref:Outer membrane protein beta-barrel domain-containing protein n=1 Tax=Rubripirellula reticaptiva TaxID=2528013 RepID=A0A5C6EIU2_9BACT|nr:hypothetical protein Poly59_48510 [Rubripirellula reticaptiva]